jgi:hypothetical protein
MATTTIELPPLNIAELTQASLAGTGVFDVLMRATKTHLDSEYSQNRIRGAEYAQVYLGSVQQVMQTALAFLTSGRKALLEAQLLEQQVLLAQAELAIAEQKVLQAQVELDIMRANAEKIPAEIALLQAQTALTVQNTANALIEHDNLTKQGCKLDAEFDVLQSTKLKTDGETALLNQKSATERAQTVAANVDPDSVIGKQKALYGAQTDGFKRNAEQSAAKILADSWSVRRTTDEGTQANTTNQLDDATVGRAVSKLLAGVGA